MVSVNKDDGAIEQHVPSLALLAASSVQTNSSRIKHERLSPVVADAIEQHGDKSSSTVITGWPLKLVVFA